MRYSFTAEYFEKSQKKYFNIKYKGVVLQVVEVMLDLDGYRQIVPAMDLRPSGDTRNQLVRTFCCPQGNQIVLIE